jgi:plasmid replication initiation protein
VRKSNNLIQARFRLNVNEYRLLLYCASKIKPKDPDVSAVFHIHGKDYAEMWDIDEKNAYKQIKEGLDSTWDREFLEWMPKGKNGEPAWRRRRFVITQEYNPGEGYGAIELHPDFLQHLIDLRDQYTDYALRNVMHLKSFNTIRIYELLCQYRKIGHRSFTVEWFRQILSLDETYPRWSDLRKHIIRPSLKMITEHTDIEVIKNDKSDCVTTRARGNKVISFEVNFRHKAQQTLDLDEPVLLTTDEPEWQREGYASPGEYREAQGLQRTHGVRFDSAKAFLVYRASL